MQFVNRFMRIFTKILSYLNTIKKIFDKLLQNLIKYAKMYARSKKTMPKALKNSYGIIIMNKWDKRFMQLAKEVSTWSSCYQENRQVGAIIVKDNRIITTGYNGAPSGVSSCKERGECLRRKMNIPSGTRHELCYAVHAEQNAIAQAAKLGISVEGATLYCTHQPCVICSKMMINSGIKRIVYCEGYPDDFSLKLLKEAGVQIEVYSEE